MYVSAKNLTNSPFELLDSSGARVRFPAMGSAAGAGDFIGAELNYLNFLKDAGLVGSVTGAAIPENTVAPVITGVAQVGVELSVSDGTWTGEPAPTFTYEWLADDEAIDGATTNKYTPVVGDVGKLISAVVTGTNVAGSDLGFSAPTAAVIAA